MNQPPRQQQNGKPRRPLTPEQIAARRARIQKRRKEVRRNRIILGIAAFVVLILLILLITAIVKGIASAINGGGSGRASAVNTQQQAEGADGIDALTDDGTDTTETDATTEEPEPEYELNFQIDLSEYERYMDPVERDDYLILVNTEHPLTEEDEPTDLTDVENTRQDGRATQQMRYTAEKALEALFLEAQAEGYLTANTPSGYPLSVTSAYRSYSTQEYLFKNYVTSEMNADSSLTQEQAEAKVLTYSCRAGTSEHQTGLSCDMHFLTSADVSFGNYDCAKWLAENSWKFGFILRFPEDKTDITGISYEPWHFRYVGRYHAYKIYSQGLCLEEYVASLEQ